MIICHRHRFIFIKTRKTAGSSVEIGLSRVCGEGDIVTPLIDRLGEEELRRSEGGYGPAGDRKAIGEHRGFKEWKRLLFYGQRAPRFGEHATAAEIRAIVDSEVWDNYYKFSLERNPWDRAVSRYYWQKCRWERKPRKKPFPCVSEYLIWLEQEKPHWITNWGHYAIGNDLAVDGMIFYETLSDDLAELAGKLGVDGDISLPAERAKGGHRTDRRPYQEVLAAKDRELIERLCSREIEAFGYEF